MKRVTGIGGIFFKARDPVALRAWYRKHLGLDIQSWGGVTFHWQTPEAPEPHGVTVWSIFPATSEYFAPSTAPFMVNYRVSDLTAVLEALRGEGCAVDDRTETSGTVGSGGSWTPRGIALSFGSHRQVRFRRRSGPSCSFPFDLDPHSAA